MKLRTACSRQIDTTPERVWEVLGERFVDVGDWASTIDTSSDVTGRPTRGLGAERTCEIPGFGETRERIVEWKDGTVVAYSATAEKLPGFVSNFVGRFELQSVDSGTLVTQVITADMAAPLGLIAFVPMRLQMRRAQRAVLRDLEAWACFGTVSKAKAKAESRAMVRSR